MERASKTSDLDSSSDIHVHRGGYKAPSPIDMPGVPKKGGTAYFVVSVSFLLFLLLWRALLYVLKPLGDPSFDRSVLGNMGSRFTFSS